MTSAGKSLLSRLIALVVSDLRTPRALAPSSRYPLLAGVLEPLTGVVCSSSLAELRSSWLDTWVTRFGAPAAAAPAIMSRPLRLLFA